jgi:hypothetical protein
MQVKQMYKDVVTLVEGDVVFHLDAKEVLDESFILGLRAIAEVSQDQSQERDLSLQQEWEL